MPDSSHTMPNPWVVPILWGHDYVANPATAKLIEQFVNDVVTGPFLNGVAQYGVRRGRVANPVVIDDTNPPATVVYYNSNNQLQDDITKKLISWIDAGHVPPLPLAAGDINQLYFIFPPSQTTPETYNNAGDPIGNGIQAWHNEGVTSPSSSVPYYWAIVKTNDCGNPDTGLEFVNNMAQKSAHELVEQLVDRNGSYKEVGDPCNNDTDTYRGWSVQKYWSNWDNGCISGYEPPPMPRSFQTVDSYSHVFVLGTDGNFWLESAPFGTVPPKRQLLGEGVFTFEALDMNTLLVLNSNGDLWFQPGPFPPVAPPRTKIDGNVQAFQALDPQTVVVLGNDGNLWFETGPWGSVPPARAKIDGNVRAFHAINSGNIFVLGTDGNLWLEQVPGQHTGPASPRQHVDGNVRAFAAMNVDAFVWVLGTDGKLWLEQAPFGKPPPARQLIDEAVLAFQPLDLNDTIVQRTDASLWLEQTPSGKFPPTRTAIDGNVMEFTATDTDHVLVLGTDGKLWLEQAPFGKPPPARQLVDETVA
jgi:hypothetical protein